MHIQVHSPRLPGYIDVAQTVLTILTMIGLFPDSLVDVLMICNHPKMTETQNINLGLLTTSQDFSKLLIFFNFSSLKTIDNFFSPIYETQLTLFS